MATFTGIEQPSGVICAFYLDAKSRSDYEAGKIAHPILTNDPLTILDLPGGEHSSWNAEIVRDMSSILRRASVEASPSRRDEGMSHFRSLIQNHINSFCEAWKDSRPRGKPDNGGLETPEEAWDRFERQYGSVSADDRRTARLILVGVFGPGFFLWTHTYSVYHILFLPIRNATSDYSARRR